MALDNRELAWLICLCAGAILLVLKARNFKQLGVVVRAALSPPIVTAFGLAAVHSSACVWLLASLGCWQPENLKTTLLWGATFVPAAMFNFEKMEAGKTFVRDTLFKAVGANAILSFFASSYTFGLGTELAIASALIILTIIYVVSGFKENSKAVRNSCETLLAVFGFAMLLNSAYHILLGFRGYATLHTVREFTVPIFLTLMFLPFVYGLYVLSTYQRSLAAFRVTVRDPGLQAGILRKLVWRFGADLKGLENWRRHVGLFPPTSHTQVEESIAEIKRSRRREKRPYRVEPARGWLPNLAINYLASVGLATNDYHRTHGGWIAHSSYRELGDDLIPNNLAYYLEGEECVVSMLKLVLNVNAPATASHAYETFVQTTALLMQRALPGIATDKFELSLESDGCPVLHNGYQLTLSRNDWTHGIEGGHDLVFTIEVAIGPDESQ